MDAPPFLMDMIEKELIEHLEGFVSRHRAERFDTVLSKRTDYITVLMENIYQPHNASAVLRTCDCFGIQEVNIIENSNEYQVNPDVALGSDKWLTINKYNASGNNTPDAYKSLRERGYRIVATTPHGDKGASPAEFNLQKGKIALAFGTEMQGLSQQAVSEADDYIRIPMFGFTESFNISVSAAIIIYELITRLHNSDIDWQLNEEEKIAVKLDWLRNSIKRSELIEKKFMDTKKLHK
ncbi:MAG: TrmH family RNA methyltransferase [Bacteroidota bacterium]